MDTAEILSQGDEVVTGQIADTNAAWLAERLTELGFRIVRHGSVGDRLEDIRELLLEASRRAQLVVCTGGLGPTDDDLTAEAAAAAFGRPLRLDADALAQIERLYSRFGREMPSVNRKQAFLPEGAQRLDNRQGTAPGFVVELDRSLLVFMPGVPREMRAMWEDAAAPLVRARFTPEPWPLVTLRTTGIGESNLQERLGRIEDDRFLLSYRTKLPENHVKLRFRPDVVEAERRRVVDDLRARIGAPVFAVEGFGEEGGPLECVVGRLLASRGASLALVEDASGGLLAALCRRMAGSDQWLRGGRVDHLRGGPDACLAAAAEARAAWSSDYGLATGVNGDETLVALSGEGVAASRAFRPFDGAERQQGLAAGAALDLLRRHLQGLLGDT